MRAITRMRALTAQDQRAVSLVISGTIDSAVERSIRREIEFAASRCRSIALRISSPGGQINAARAIARDLEQISSEVEATAGELVGSAAILPFIMAGRRQASRSSRFFIHRGHFDLHGYDLKAMEAPRLRKMADFLDGADTEELDSLRRRMCVSDALAAAMRHPEGLTLTASLALALGLVHEIDGGQKGCDHAAYIIYRNAPLAVLKERGLAWPGVRP